MTRLLAILTAVTCLGIAGALATGPALSSTARDTAFSGANAAYAEGDFDAALAAYRKLVADGDLAPSVFFNLANTHYRLGDDGLATLNYRRALALAPTHGPAAQNLRFLRRELGYLQPPPPAATLLADLLPSATWTSVLVGGAWLVALPVTALLCLRRRNIPALASLAVVGVLAVTVATTALVTRHVSAVPATDVAVVTAPDSIALTAPADGAGTVSELPPGSALHILARRGPWLYTAIDEDTEGWVHASATQPLWPFDPNLIP